MTPVTVNREQFLRTLEQVQPGLSPKEIVEQSNCVVFLKGEAVTFNDEICCRGPSGLGKALEGAVPAAKLAEILSKLPEDEVQVEATEDRLWIVGKGKRSYVRLEREIALPVKTVEKPGEWLPLHDDFCEAVGLVGTCASNDPTTFEITCVHVHPKWVEASDNFQICRWRMKTGVKAPLIVKATAIRHVASLGMKEFSETDGWIHFRNDAGLTMSLRRYQAEDFRDLTPFLKVEGKSVNLPKGLMEAVPRAEIFSKENNEANQVLVRLKAGEVRVEGHGVSGGHEERKKVKWTGDPLTFLIAPSMLVDLVKRHNECQIAPDRLKVDAGSYVYVACLVAPDAVDPDDEPEGKPAKAKRAVDSSDEEDGPAPAKARKKVRKEEEE